MSKHWQDWHISEMADEECIKLLMPPRLSFWLHNHLLFIWRIRYWNWFNIWTGEKGFLLFARHWFREWGK